MSEPSTSRSGSGKHWADREAETIDAAGRRPAVVATGISPSGPFHVGHLREILTGDAVARALRQRGVDARLVFIVDNLDPLRKVYPFLDEETYAPLVGHPLNSIPAPGHAEGSYDQHFLRPFLGALERLRVDAEILPAAELYGNGRMDDVVFTALEQRDRIAGIIADVTGKTVDSRWSPWNPLDPETGRISDAEVTAFDREGGWIEFRPREGGPARRQTVREGGKLTWRVDWPARWKALGVTVEPFGKDHASRGGSFDTGRRLAREVFGCEEPHPVVYEWISLKGQGDMAASKGNVLEPSLLLEMVPPEVLRYLVLKSRPTRAIRFDPGAPLLRLVDEVDDASARGVDRRALELSQAAGFRPVGVPFKHLVLVGQITGFQLDRALDLLRGGGYEGLDSGAVGQRLEMARRWLERFAPESEKIALCATLPASASDLAEDQRRLLGRLAERLDSSMSAEQIQELIRELAGGEDGPGVASGFQAVYRVLIDRDRGPRAGTFIRFLGTEVAAQRFAEAARSQCP